MKQIIKLRITIVFFLLFLGTNIINAQQDSNKMVLDSIITNSAIDSTKFDSNTAVNKWSIEFAIGSNTAVRPFGSGYSSSENNFFSLPSINHFDFGFRYMINSKFGIKSDFAFDIVSNKNGNGSLSFQSMQSRFGIQGVFDLGKVFEFNNFSNSIGLLAHGGIQFSQFKSKKESGNTEAVTEKNGGLLFGLSPQIKLSDRTVLTFDFTVLSNVRQHLNWDGSTSAQENNLTGLLYSTSIGLVFYLGKEAKHSDWYVPKVVAQVDPEVNSRLDEIETRMNDTDKDGVLDNVDFQNNTPSGVFVDSKGRYLDTNRNGTPDEFEPKVIEDFKNQNLEIQAQQSEANAFKSLLENGFVNVFYDVNEAEPNRSSANSIYGLISLLKRNKNVNIRLEGFSDHSGSEKANLNLSKLRVKNLYNLLLLGGISETRIKIIGHGEDNTINSKSKTALQLARRVSVLLD
jgi:OOP family OmpA-OmpF porin